MSIVQLGLGYQPDFGQTLNIGSWNYLQQIPTVIATFLLETIVRISNISVGTDLIWTKL